MLETKDIGIELPRLSIYYDFRFKIAFKEFQPLMLASPAYTRANWVAVFFRILNIAKCENLAAWKEICFNWKRNGMFISRDTFT